MPDPLPLCFDMEGVATGIAFGAVPGLPNGQTLAINNLGFKVDYSGVPWHPSQVTFDYVDMGGFENLALNGQPVPPYAGELTAAPCPLAGIACAFTPDKATSTGTISSVQFGGQELWIDNLCALP